MKFTRRHLIAPAAVVGFFALTAESCGSSGAAKQGGESAQAAQTAVQTGFDRLQKSQPIPLFDWSAIRQTLIDVETVQANGVATTTAFYLEGIGLVAWCPSAGLPVPSTYQLSNSTQYVDLPDDSTSEKYPIDQGEPTGVYVGPTTGTYTICLDDNGKGFAHYWEGYTASDSGLVAYPDDLRLTLTGDPTYQFETGES